MTHPEAVVAEDVGIGIWVGIGSCIKNNIKIGANCIVGAGSVVIRDLPDDCTAIGTPAKQFN